MDIGVPVDSRIFRTAESGFLEFKNVAVSKDGVFSARREQVPLCLAGYALEAGEVLFDSSRLTLNNVRVVSLPKGFSDGTMLDQGYGQYDSSGLTLAFNMERDTIYQFDGWNLYFAGLVLDGNGLGGNGKLVIRGDEYASEIMFPDFRIQADGSIASGKALADDVYILIGEIAYNFQSAQFDKRVSGYELALDGLYYQSVSVDMGALKLGKADMRSDATLSYCDTGTTEVHFESANLYDVIARRYTIQNEKLLISGSIRPVWWKENEYAVFDNFGIACHSGAYIDCAQASGPVSYSLAGQVFKAKSAQFDYYMITLEDNTVIYGGKRFSFGTVVYDVNGDIQEESYCEADETIEVNGASFYLKSLILDGDGVSADAFLRLPDSLGASEIYLDSMIFNADGTFGVEDKIEHFFSSIGVFAFDFEDLYIDVDGIFIGRTRFTIEKPGYPTADMHILGLLVGFNGSFHIEDSRIDPFILWNMEIGTKSFKIDDGILQLEGALRIPYDLEYPLGGRVVELRNLQINQDGKLLVFDAVLEGEVNYQVDANHYVISRECEFAIWDGYPCLILKNAEVRLTATYELAYSKKVDVVFNLASGKIVSPKKF